MRPVALVPSTQRVINLNAIKDASLYATSKIGVLISETEAGIVWLQWSALQSVTCTNNPCQLRLDFGAMIVIFEYDHLIHLGSAMSHVVAHGMLPAVAAKNADEFAQSRIRKYAGETR